VIIRAIEIFITPSSRQVLGWAPNCTSLSQTNRQERRRPARCASPDCVKAELRPQLEETEDTR